MSSVVLVIVSYDFLMHFIPLWLSQFQTYSFSPGHLSGICYLVGRGGGEFVRKPLSFRCSNLISYNKIKISR